MTEFRTEHILLEFAADNRRSGGIASRARHSLSRRRMEDDFLEEPATARDWAYANMGAQAAVNRGRAAAGKAADSGGHRVGVGQPGAPPGSGTGGFAPPPPPPSSSSGPPPQNRPSQRWSRGHSVAAAAIPAALVAAKPIGRAVGKVVTGRRDPQYDMNFRQGQQLYHNRARNMMEDARSKALLGGLATVAGGVGIGKGYQGFKQGQYERRRDATTHGFEDEYRRMNQREEDSFLTEEELQEYLMSRVGDNAIIAGGGAAGPAYLIGHFRGKGIQRKLHDRMQRQESVPELSRTFHTMRGLTTGALLTGPVITGYQAGKLSGLADKHSPMERRKERQAERRASRDEEFQEVSDYDKALNRERAKAKVGAAVGAGITVAGGIGARGVTRMQRSDRNRIRQHYRDHFRKSNDNFRNTINDLSNIPAVRRTDARLDQARNRRTEEMQWHPFLTEEMLQELRLLPKIGLATKLGAGAGLGAGAVGLGYAGKKVVDKATEEALDEAIIGPYKPSMKDNRNLIRGMVGVANARRMGGNPIPDGMHRYSATKKHGLFGMRKAKVGGQMKISGGQLSHMTLPRRMEDGLDEGVGSVLNKVGTGIMALDAAMLGKQGIDAIRNKRAERKAAATGGFEGREENPFLTEENLLERVKGETIRAGMQFANEHYPKAAQSLGIYSVGRAGHAKYDDYRSDGKLNFK